MNKLYQNKEWLYKKYIIEELSSNEIGEICKCNGKTILTWLKKYNIRIRSLSEALSGKKNPFYGKHLIPWNKGIPCSEDTKKKISETIKKNGHSWLGRKHTKETKEKLSEQKKGVKNPQWKGGKKTDRNGYIYILKPDHPYCNNNGYIFEHRLVMESFLKEYLNPKEIIHHINGITGDNRLSNLTIFKNSSLHTQYHHKIRRMKIFNEKQNLCYNTL